MVLKPFILSTLLALSTAALAHDEGHGPKLTDGGKYGGVVSPVVDLKDSKKGAKADLVYKAELVRSADGKVRVYLYNKDMSPLDLKTIDKSAKGFLGAMVKGKRSALPFAVTLEEKSFVGTMPKPPAKPYDLDFQFKEPKRELLTAFDNLD